MNNGTSLVQKNSLTIMLVLVAVGSLFFSVERVLGDIVFNEPFSNTSLDAAWTVDPLSYGTYSLTDKPGHLRMQLTNDGGNVFVDSLRIYRSLVNGTGWTMEFYVDYGAGFNTSGTRQGRQQYIEVQIANTVNGSGPRITWYRDKDCCSSPSRDRINALISEPGFTGPAMDISPGTDQFFVRMTRSGNEATIEYKRPADANYTVAVTYTFQGTIASTNWVYLTGTSYANEDSYADYDYLSIGSGIEPGCDLFQTASTGTNVDFTSIGGLKVEMQGNPALLASANLVPTDTIVRRLDAIGYNDFPATINIEIVALSLQSKAPFDMGFLAGFSAGTMADLYVTINKLGLPDLPQPDTLMPSNGTMTVDHSGTNGGNFSSSLSIYSNLIFVPAGGNISNTGAWLANMADPTAPQSLTSMGIWSHTPGEGSQNGSATDVIGCSFDGGGFDGGGGVDGGFNGGGFNVIEIEHTGPHAVDPTLISLTYFYGEIINDEIIVSWQTDAEVDNAGFYLWRSEQQKGKYKKITDNLIPAEGSGSTYNYTDATALNETPYWYKLEDIDLNGVSTLHDPVSVTLASAVSNKMGVKSPTDKEANSFMNGGSGAFSWWLMVILIFISFGGYRQIVKNQRQYGEP